MRKIVTYFVLSEYPYFKISTVTTIHLGLPLAKEKMGQRHSCRAELKATYLPSAVEVGMTECVLEFPDAAYSARQSDYPDVDSLSSFQLAQSKSLFPIRISNMF